MDKKYARSFLITGGCGFIGSNFVNYFVQKYTSAGAKIIKF